MFCLCNKFVHVTNQKQLLKCVRQNNYLDLGSYTSYYLTRSSSFSKITDWRTNKSNLSHAQKLHYRTAIFEENLPMSGSSLKYDRNIIIIKRIESLKLFSYKEVARICIEKKC